MSSVVLLDYQPAWPSLFEEAASELAAVFAFLPVRVEHIGSTSVPGLCAKPVLDLLLGAPDLESVASRADALARIGYRYRPEYEDQIPDRRYFVRPEDTLPKVHLHAVVQGGRLWRNHLAFRDALRRDPSLAGEYATLKRRLAAQHRDDKAAYTEAKAPFIARVLADHPGRGAV